MKKSLFLLAFSVLTSCSVMSTSMDDFMGLEKGMSKEEAVEIVDNSSFGEFDIKVDAQAYNIVSYNVLISKSETTETYYVPGTPATSNKDIKNSVPDERHTRTNTDIYTSRFYLVFKDKSLMTWGFLFELLRDNDEEWNNIGDMIYTHDLQNK